MDTSHLEDNGPQHTPSLALSFCSLFCDLLLSLEEAIWLSSFQLGSQPSFILNIWTNHESIINHCLPQRSSSDQLAQQRQSLRLSIKAWKTIWQAHPLGRTAAASALGSQPWASDQVCSIRHAVPPVEQAWIPARGVRHAAPAVQTSRQGGSASEQPLPAGLSQNTGSGEADSWWHFLVALAGTERAGQGMSNSVQLDFSMSVTRACYVFSKSTHVCIYKIYIEEICEA